MVKNTPVNAEDTGSIPGFGIFSGEGNDSQLQYSCLENTGGLKNWRAIIHWVTKVIIHFKL